MREKLKIEDLKEYSFLSSLKRSPDGTKCLFVRHQMDVDMNSYRHYIYCYDDVGGKIEQITTGGEETSPLWLNDDTILFSKKRERNSSKKYERYTDYFAVKLYDASEPCFYMSIPATVIQIDLLDNGLFAVLAKSYIPDEYSNIDSEQIDTWDYSDNEICIVGDELPFRQDGLGITNGMRHRCFIYNKQTDSLCPVSGKNKFIESFSTKGNKIIFSAREFFKNSAYLFYGDVEVYDSDSGKLEILMDDNTYRVYGVGFVNEKPAFAGTKGLLHGYQNENSSFFYFNNNTPECFCFNDRSTNNTVGTDVRYGSVSSFISDGGGFYYVGTEGGAAVLKYASSDGEITELTSRDGTVNDFAILKDKIICIAMYSNSPEEIYCITKNTRTRITDFNNEINERRTISNPQTIHFKSADTEIEGYVIHPVNYNEKDAYPAILYIHGGHKCAFGPIYYHEMQVWANLGFFVLYCNPRGSDGRDDNFADIIGHYGFYEEEDLLRFKDECLKRFPQIDQNRIGIGGGSYGGYLTNWMIGRTHCFKCAVSQRGIASWNSMFFTSDTNYLFPCWSTEPNTVWMDYEKYWEHSPLKYANQCDTPTLFIHSECDYRCPVSEGISMFHALQYNGVESRICIFKGQSHGLSRSGSPQSRIRRLTEITNWFIKYLL